MALVDTTADAPRRIGMWSGPRNISTAMMRAWEHRGDCAVSDEPFYAAYLAATGLDHPGRDEVIAAGEVDAGRVIATLLGPVPDGRPLWFQKQMAHHLLPGIDTRWLQALDNVFLIREPHAVVASYLQSRQQVVPDDIGLLQQARLFDEVADRLGRAPPVVDADAFLKAPEAQLRGLCDRLGLHFTPRMLHWPPGPRPSDGVWAPHWYAAVWRSSGFEPWRPREARLDGAALDVARACLPAYEKLLAFAA